MSRTERNVEDRANVPARSAGIGLKSVGLAGATGIAQVVLAAMYILVARLSGPEDYGSIIVAIALGMTVCTFLDFGSNSLWIREGASGRLNTIQLGDRASAKIGIAAISLSMWTSALVFVPDQSLWVSGPIALATLTSQTAQVGPRRLGKIGIVSITVLADRMAGLVTLATLVYVVRVDALTALWCSLFVGSCVGSILCLALLPRGERLMLGWRITVNPWRGSKYYGLAGVAGGIQSLEMQVIGGIGGSHTVGIFGAVNRWTQPLGLLTNAFSSAAVPFVAAATTWQIAWPTIRRALWLPLTAMGGALLAVCLAPFAVPLLLGSDYDGAIPVLQLLALGTIPGIANQTLAVFLQARGKDRIVSYILFVAAVAQLAAVASLTAVFGAVGAALASSSVQLLPLIGLTLVALRSHPTRWKGRRA